MPVNTCMSPAMPGLDPKAACEAVAFVPGFRLEVCADPVFVFDVVPEVLPDVLVFTFVLMLLETFDGVFVLVSVFVFELSVEPKSDEISELAAAEPLPPMTLLLVSNNELPVFIASAVAT